MLPGRSSVGKRWPSSWNGLTSLVTLTVTPVARPIGVSAYLSTTVFALSPAGPDSTATEMVPSAPWNTVVVAMSIFSFSLLEVHDDLHEIDREGGLEDHRDDRLAVDLLRPRRRHVELVAGQHLVEHHAREEAVEGGLERRPHPH